MVLLNGVKYACERCIRGHRVSSCTHTDKPLTMIKPKGRPASQCPHCREQRKLKNAHASCSCGKKGKSPGQHLASCLCHKNSHCTCPSKEKKAVAAAKKEKRLVESSTARPFEKDSFGEEQNLAPTGSALNSNYLIEDVVVPFETDQGLLDYFSKHQLGSSELDNSQFNGNGPDTKPERKVSEGLLESKQFHPQQLQGLNLFPNPPSDADLDFVENMFPLFPLVGNCSFDDSKSLPLLPMPHSSATQQLIGGNKPLDFAKARVHEEERPFSATRYNNSSSSFAQANSSYGGSQTFSNGNIQNSNAHSLTSLAGINTPGNLGTQHPRPLKPSTSFSGSGNLHQSRPRRPESVLSIASTSSNASKQNLLEASAAAQANISQLAASGAFPPFQLSDNNSSDDFNHAFYESSGIFNDAHLLSILSDYDDLARGGYGNTTPQSSLPSRQPLQTRRKTSLSRSHSQLHYNHNNSTMNKEHPLLPLKSASSTDSSPHQSPSVNFTGDQLTHLRPVTVESLLRKVSEEIPPSLMSNMGSIPMDSSELAPVSSTYMNGMASNSGQPTNYVEYLEISAVPMYLEFVNP